MRRFLGGFIPNHYKEVSGRKKIGESILRQSREAARRFHGKK